MNLLTFFKKTKINFYSRISGKISVEAYMGKRTLYMNDIPQSGGEFEYMWKKVIGDIPNKHITSCLILGVGGATALKYVREKYDSVPITGIEIDPVIIEIQQKYFSFKDENNVHLIPANAISWVSGYTSKNKFDLIIIDLYHNRLNPKEARTSAFISKIKKIVSSNGLVIFNAHYEPEKPKDLEKLLQICRKEFGGVKEIFKYKYNRVLLLKN